MQNENKPCSNTAYGRWAFRITMSGLALGITGMILYLGSQPSFLESTALLDALLSGSSVEEILKISTHKSSAKLWFVENITLSDSIAMLGISLTSLAAVTGISSLLLTMILRKEKPVIYINLALLLLLLLILSASGVFSL
ncbi:MAG TPA: hypothetical protein VKS21_00785 [Spirochaetota bacterium]|nr:hypothetical protein [Spirochaetota bacterium]